MVCAVHGDRGGIVVDRFVNAAADGDLDTSRSASATSEVVDKDFLANVRLQACSSFRRTA
jgi:hypothetical protein